ncbi:MAG: WG repeat-containing protein [Candidatus Obscuribacterales bacterium]
MKLAGTVLTLFVGGFLWSAPVLAGEQFGLFELNGKEVLPCKYAEIREIGKEQFAVTPFVGGSAPQFDFAIDRMGWKVERDIPPKPSPYDSSNVPYVQFSEESSSGIKFGLKHRDGRVIIPLSANSLGTVIDVGEGLFEVKNCLPTYDFSYLLDRNNIVASLAPEIVPSCYQFSCGFLPVNVKVAKSAKSGESATFAACVGFVNKKGTLVATLPASADSEGFSDNVAAYAVREGRDCWSYIVDTTGHTIKCSQPNFYLTKFKNGRAVAISGKPERLLRGLVNKQGKILLPIVYDVLEDHGNYFFVKKDNVFSVLNQDFSKLFDFPKGTTSVLPCGDNGWFVYAVGGKAREHQQPNEPYADAKFGYVDRKGQIKLPAQFDSALGFERGFAIVAKPHLGSIDQSGKFYLPPVFNKVVRTKQQVIVSKEFIEFKPTYPPTEANMEAQLKLAAASPDCLSLRQMQSLAYAYYAEKNRVDLAAKYDKLLANKVCPVCHSDKDVLPVSYGLRPKLAPGQFSGGCSVSFASPRWGCVKDQVVF